MAPEATPAAAAAASGPPDKVRIRFRKGGSLRLLSHHDLMRTFERMLRRAAIPFRRSQGFHPKPRLVFALSLPLGVIGGDEVVELELDRTLPPEEVHERLARQAPPGLEIHSVRRVGPRSTARVCGLTYALPIPSERLPLLQQRIGEVLASTACWIERTRPPRRRLDLRPFLRALRLEGPSVVGQVSSLPAGPGWQVANLPHNNCCTLFMDLRLTDNGTARPEEVAQLLGLEDLLASGAVFERTRLELADEHDPSSQ